MSISVDELKSMLIQVEAYQHVYSSAATKYEALATENYEWSIGQEAKAKLLVSMITALEGQEAAEAQALAEKILPFEKPQKDA